MNYLRCSVVVSLFAVLLSACGIESTQAPERTSSESVRVGLQGQAHQGVVQSARVEVFKLEGDIRRRLASTITDSKGDFSITLERPDHPLLLEVTAAENSDSRLACSALDGCDNAAFGEPRPMPEDFRLTTLVMPNELDDGPVAVTPLTHIATGWARAMPGPVDAQSLHLARERVAGLMHLPSGFAFQRLPDLTKDTTPVADASAARHALMATAFARRAAETKRPIQQSLDGHLEAFVDHAGQFRTQGHYSLQGLLTSARELARERAILPDTRKQLRALATPATDKHERMARADLQL